MGKLTSRFGRLLKMELSPDPMKLRWDHFLNDQTTIPLTLSLVNAVPDSKLRDTKYLETELLPALGLNDENLNEQPEELSKFFGTGLHIFQYPNQFAAYLAWLSDHATETRSYVEIGSRWGGTFIITCEWLRRIGAPLNTVIAIDPIGETPLLKAYGQHLSKQSTNYSFVKDLSSSPVVRSLFESTQPSFVFIDGDHSMNGALSDHMLARKSADIIVHHDIASDACPESTTLWQYLKELESRRFDHFEFIDQYTSVQGSFLGIGALKRST